MRLWPRPYVFRLQSGMAPKALLPFLYARSGVLACTQVGDFIELDFPATPAAAMARPCARRGIGRRAGFYGQVKFYVLAEVKSADVVRCLQPDFHKLLEIPTLGVIATAASDDPKFDFISRFFAPALGVNEDPVCGSAHCRPAAYWAERLGKSQLTAYQASARGGVLRLKLDGDRVTLGGQAVTIWQGELV